MKKLTINAFEDGSTLTIEYAGKDAEMAFFAHIRPAVGRVRRNILEAAGVCCNNLKNALGDHKQYPTLVFISTSDFERHSPECRYPGATRGNRFYSIYDVDDPENTEEESRVTFVPLEFCPFCHTNLEDAI